MNAGETLSLHRNLPVLVSMAMENHQQILRLENFLNWMDVS